jgi:hypothetical protein
MLGELLMAMSGRVPTEQVEGVVEATNAKGLKIAGAWVNVSQFRPVEIPEPGTYARVDVDSKGYIRQLEVLSERKTAGLERDDHITRLAVLKAASYFLGQLSQTREEVRSDHVLVLADKWLAWVNQ